MDPAVVETMTRLLDVPLRPPVFPAGEQPWCAWADAPTTPLQTCAIPGAPNTYQWNRTVRCFAAPAGLERLPREVDCVNMMLGAPVVAEETGAIVVPAALTRVAAEYTYAMPQCSVTVQLAPWKPAEGLAIPPPARFELRRN